MSKFVKTESNLGQNVLACLLVITGNEAFAALENPIRPPGETNSPHAWLPADTKRGLQGLTPGWVIEKGILVNKTDHFLCRTSLGHLRLQP